MRNETARFFGVFQTGRAHEDDFLWKLWSGREITFESREWRECLENRNTYDGTHGILVERVPAYAHHHRPHPSSLLFASDIACSTLGVDSSSLLIDAYTRPAEIGAALQVTVSTDAETSNGNIRGGNPKLAAVSRGPLGWDILRARMAKRRFRWTSRAQGIFILTRRTDLFTASAEAFYY